MQEYNICYSLDSEYTEQLAASIVSILKNSDEKENINFYILDGGLSKKDKTAIETLKNSILNIFRLIRKISLPVLFSKKKAKNIRIIMSLFRHTSDLKFRNFSTILIKYFILTAM